MDLADTLQRLAFHMQHQTHTVTLVLHIGVGESNLVTFAMLGLRVCAHASLLLNPTLNNRRRVTTNNDNELTKKT